MFGDATSLWFSASNVIQSLNNNITSALESLDQELGENDEKSDEDIYKKLLEDAQMHHFELSKQFRAIVSEKDAELAIWKKKCGELCDTDSEELKAEIDSAKLQSELTVLRETVKNMEGEIKVLLESSNETIGKLSRHNDVVKERDELRTRLTDLISSSGQLETQKAGELEGLVAEYSKLAAESESQKSSDSLRIRELELENEELVTKMQALEHSIGELADRSSGLSSLPSSPTRSGAPMEPASDITVDAAIVKELKAKIVHLEYDKQEKEDKIVELTASIQRLKSEQPSDTTSASIISPEELQSLQNRLSKTVDELANVQQDVSRLRIEKQEAEAAGKSFHEKLKALQKEVDAEKVRVQAEGSVSTASLSSYESTITQLQTELQTSRAETDELKTKIVDLETKLGVSRESAAAVEATAAALSEEIAVLKTEAAESASITESRIAEFQASIDDLHSTISSLSAAHKEEIAAVKAASNELLASSSSEMVQNTIKELTVEKTRVVAELEATHASQIEGKDKTIHDLESTIAKLKGEIEQLNVAHATALANLETALRAESEETAARKVQEALDAAGNEKAIALEEQRVLLEEAAKSATVSALSEQAKVHGQVLESEKSLWESAKVTALNELRSELDAATDHKIAEIYKSHKEAISSLRSECEETQQQAVLAEKSRGEEALHAARDEATRAMEQLKAEHMAAVNDLNEKMAAIQLELKNIENKYVEKLTQQLDALRTEKDAEMQNALQTLRAEMQMLVDSANAAREEYLAMYTKESKARKALHNKLMDIQGNIRVICRVRPILEVERRSGEDVDVTEIPSEEDIIITKDASTKNRFEFDRVFDPMSTQNMVFEAVQPLVVSVLDGYNVCIFAYGQTGSGKTFTMEGYGSDVGMSPRAISELFEIINSVADNWTYTVTFSTLEIYNESIRDLLDSSGKKDKLDIRQGPEGNQVVGLTEVEVTSPEQVHQLMSQGQSNRAVGSHDMNEHSSRSHSILTLTCRGRNHRDGSTTYGKLHMIDLAGSERVGKTDATGDRLKEAQNINRSLSALGDVINSLGSKKATHVPYRNSKLTFLLQDSLGGNSKVLMFVNISPAVYNVGESICSLNFASRCRNVELGQARKQIDKKPSASLAPPSASDTLATPAKSSSSATASASSARRTTISATPSVRK